MSLFLRRVALVLPLLIAASALPAALPARGPHVRHWALALADGKQIKVPGTFGLIGVSWPRSEPAPAGVTFRTSKDGRHWSAWDELDPHPDGGPDTQGREQSAVRATEPKWTGIRRFVQVHYVGRRPHGARVHLIDPGPDPSVPLPSAQASPGQPTIISRSQWGADESIRKGHPEYTEPLMLALIHHTVTADNYSRSQSAGIVRSIYTYHVKTNGWNDIGYNFLVDRYGQIFEGRYGGITRTVTGAHAYGFNTHSTGIAVLGTFTGGKPPEVAMQSLKSLVSWRLDQGYLDPAGATLYTSGGSDKWPAGTKVSLKTVSGHLDTVNTECPGQPIYGALGWLRGAAHSDGLPKLFNATLSRTVVTPNGDGVSDGLRFTGTLSSSLSWKVDVVDYAGNVVTSVSGTGTAIDVPWWARDSSGAIVPQDVYQFRVSASGSAGAIRTASFPFQVWRYMDGAFFIAQPSKTTYILDHGQLRHPSTWQTRSTRYDAAEGVSVADGDVTSAYAKGPDIGFREGTLARVNGQVYAISGGQKRPASSSALSALGYDSSAIIDADNASIATHPTGPALDGSAGHPDGATLRATDGTEAWMMGSTAHHFASSNVRSSYMISDADLAGPADAEIAAGTAADPIGFRDGTLVQLGPGTTIYLIADGQSHAISTDREFSQMGYKSSNVRTATAAELAVTPPGSSL